MYVLPLPLPLLFWFFFPVIVRQVPPEYVHGRIKPEILLYPSCHDVVRVKIPILTTWGVYLIGETYCKYYKHH